MTLQLKKRNRLNYQTLENRRLLAGDVTVFESDHLFIRGDQADNQFEVVAVEGQLEIRGLDGTTINGEDSYVVAGATVTDSGVSFAGGLRAHLGPGNDDFAVLDAQFESMSLIYGGTGDDSVDIIDSRFMDRATIQTYDGNDSITTSGSHFDDTFYAITLDGQDSVSLTDSMFADNSFVVTGNHADAIESDGNHYMGDVNLVLPLDGDDTVQLTNPVVGDNQLGIYLGNGDDTIAADLTEASVQGTLKIGGQAGVDQVTEMAMSAETADHATVNTIEQLHSFELGEWGREIESVWWTFDRGASVAVEDFNHRANAVEFTETTQINSIDWLGAYYGSEAPESDNFVVEIFENEVLQAPGGYFFRQPAVESVARFNIGDDANRVDTGEVFNDAPNFTLQDEQGVDRKIFSYSADIDFEFTAGETYWVSIYAVRDAPTDSPSFANDLNDFDFGVLLDVSDEKKELFPVTPSDPDLVAEFGEFFSAIPSDTTQDNPYRNNNAVLYGEGSGLGFDPSLWLFSTTDMQTIFALSP